MKSKEYEPVIDNIFMYVLHLIILCQIKSVLIDKRTIPVANVKSRRKDEGCKVITS